MTNVLPPVQDVALRVDVSAPPVEAPVVNRYVAPAAPEPEIVEAVPDLTPSPVKRIQTDPVIDNMRQEAREKRLKAPITDVRLGRAILYAATLKERRNNGQPLRARTPVI